MSISSQQPTTTALKARSPTPEISQPIDIAQYFPITNRISEPNRQVQNIWKPLVDTILSAVILGIVSPLFLLICLVIKLTSKGPIFYQQYRHGQWGKKIKVLKFRTMKDCESQYIIHQARKDDPRLTWIGKWLRHTSLDEIPQFINVLQGTMSIVGPRPHALSHGNYYNQHIKDYALRHLVKPGITGLAQVNGWRGETDTLYKMEKRVEYDLRYIKDHCFRLDIQIILKTVPTVLRRDNAH